MSSSLTPSDITGIITCIGTLFAAFIAARAIRNASKDALSGRESSEKVARQRATLDIIFSQQENETYLKKRKLFIELRDNKETRLITWADKDKKDSEQALAITATINRYEMISIGIQKGIICEDIYKDWLISTVIKDWEAVESFVTEMRSQNNMPKLYEHFQKMTEAFKNGQSLSPFSNFEQK